MKLNLCCLVLLFPLAMGAIGEKKIEVPYNAGKATFTRGKLTQSAAKTGYQVNVDAVVMYAPFNDKKSGLSKPAGVWVELLIKAGGTNAVTRMRRNLCDDKFFEKIKVSPQPGPIEIKQTWSSKEQILGYRFIMKEDARLDAEKAARNKKDYSYHDPRKRVLIASCAAQYLGVKPPGVPDDWSNDLKYSDDLQLKPEIWWKDK